MVLCLCDFDDVVLNLVVWSCAEMFRKKILYIADGKVGFHLSPEAHAKNNVEKRRFIYLKER